MSSLTLLDWLSFFAHFVMLSLLSVGGALGTAPEMNRYVVAEHGWLTDAQFTSSIALAQAAPGPNVLFVAVVGFNVAGVAGALVAMFGMILPSSTIVMMATRWGQARRDTRGVRAFVDGMLPISIGLLGAAAWIMARPISDSAGAMIIALVVAGVLLRTKVRPQWLVAAGALLGALGWV
jgi:chromate transporter